MASSLDQNPPNADRHITPGGSNWLWAVFAVMLLSDLIMIFWTFTRPRGTRLFHQIAVIVLTTASIAYFSMASDLGATPVIAEFSRGNTTARQIWFVRYIQWFITFPLLLLELLLATGLSISDIFTTIFMAWVVVVCTLVGALVPSRYKWGYYAFACMATLYIMYVLLGHGRRTNFAAGGVVRTGYVRGSGYLAMLLPLYLIAWGCSEGGNVIFPTGEMIWYGILDILAFPVFLFSFLWGLRRVDYAAFGLLSTKASDGAGGAGTYGNGAGNATTGAGTGVAGPGMANRAAGPGVMGHQAAFAGHQPGVTGTGATGATNAPVV